MQLLVGGYTKHDSKGIYELSLSGKDAQARLKMLGNIVPILGPTYFVADGNLLFTIAVKGNQGGIASFLLSDHNSKKIDEHLWSGNSPAYLGINKDKHLLYMANYHSALIAVFRYDKQGKLTLLDSVTIKAQTLGPRHEQSDGSHPHYFNLTPEGHLVVCDLGNDALYFFKLNENDKLEQIAKYQFEAGYAPRHVVFATNRPYMYVVGELSSQLSVIKYDEDTWDFERIATYSTIPDDFTDHNGAAAIRISSDNNYIYVSNRGHNSIAVFKSQADFSLQLIQRISTYGSFPRDFNWDASERYVVAANQTSNNVTLYLRNEVTGTLAEIQKDVTVPEGTCVLFLN